MIYCLRASGQLVVMGMNMILGAVGTLEGAKLAGQRGNNYSDWDKAQKKCEPFHLDIVVWVGWFSCRHHEENLLWDTSTHHLDFSWLSCRPFMPETIMKSPNGVYWCPLKGFPHSECAKIPHQ